MSPLATIPITTALLQVVKGLGLPDRFKKFLPVGAMAIGVVVVWLLGADGLLLKAIITEGLITGLSASGLYSTAKPLLKK